MEATDDRATRERQASGDEPSLDASASQLWADVQRVAVSARRVVFVESQRIHLFAVETYFRAAFYLCLLGFALTASIAASVFVVRGIHSALRAWTGVEWIGELGAGLVVLAVVFAGGRLVRANLSRTIVKRVRRRLEPPPAVVPPSSRPGEVAP